MSRHITRTIISLALLLFALTTQAAVLQDIQFAELPGEKAELKLMFDQRPEIPTGYSIDQPARIVLDFVGVDNGLPEKKYTMNVGDINGAVVVAGGGRTRLIVNLANLVPYTSSVDGNTLIVEVGGGSATPSTVAQTAPAASTSTSTSQAVQYGSPSRSSRPGVSAIENIDFRRGELGEGKVLIQLTDPSVKVDVEEKANGIEVKFLGTDLPSEFRRVLDVMDFATPVTKLAATTQAGATVIKVAATGEYDYLAYQADREYVISVKPLTRQEIEDKRKKFDYTGERLSLSFQDIPVRNVLQLIADFTDFNLVASDTVSGNITLRLENVPWDQALDIVLKTKGLDKRQMGNVLMIAPAAEIAERERQEIETKKQLEELAPLRTEYIRIRYANARELFDLFRSQNNGSGSGGFGGGRNGQDGNSTGSILSERGQAIVDERTNSIILTDTEEKISDFKAIVEQIDIPIRQVMIEARIVVADTNFREELGFQITAGAANNNGSNTHTVNGLVDLDVFNAPGAFSWNVLGDNFLLDMELTALQGSGYAEIVSQPKVITGDKQRAEIMSGTEIPYQEESASGGSTVAFKEAVLSLEVVPQITPDNRIIMDLLVTQDSATEETVEGVPILDITRLETQVLVDDGSTIVLGGVYQNETFKGETKIPLLGDIPYVGRMFRNDVYSEEKRELLLFITPRIMPNELTD